MPTIRDLLKNQNPPWYQGAGPNFYLPQAHPHLHLGVTNAQNPVNSFEEIRNSLNFLAISTGNPDETIQIWKDGALYGNVEELRGTVSWFLRNKIPADQVVPWQYAINTLTGLGVDT